MGVAAKISRRPPTQPQSQTQPSQRQILYWYDPLNPDYRSDKAGKRLTVSTWFPNTRTTSDRMRILSINRLIEICAHNKFMVLLIVGVLTLAGLWSIKNICLFCDIRITGVSTTGLKFMLCFMRVS